MAEVNNIKKRKSKLGPPPSIDENIEALEKAETEKLHHHNDASQNKTISEESKVNEGVAPTKQLNLKVSEDFYFEFKAFALINRKKMKVLATEILTDYMGKNKK